MSEEKKAEQDEREEFEASFKAWTGQSISFDKVTDDEGDERYADEWLQGAWIGWQYSAASTSDDVAQDAENTDDIAVDSFARAMKEKMAAARAKGRSGWEGCEPADLSRMLREHIEKGDPRDVANFCMMLWHHSAPIAPPAQTALTDAAIEAGWHQTFSTNNPYCPCNLKSFTKAVQWAERALTAAQSGVKS